MQRFEVKVRPSLLIEAQKSPHGRGRHGRGWGLPTELLPSPACLHPGSATSSYPPSAPPRSLCSPPTHLLLLRSSRLRELIRGSTSACKLSPKPCLRFLSSCLKEVSGLETHGKNLELQSNLIFCSQTSFSGRMTSGASLAKNLPRGW